MLAVLGFLPGFAICTWSVPARRRRDPSAAGDERAGGELRAHPGAVDVQRLRRDRGAQGPLRRSRRDFLKAG